MYDLIGDIHGHAHALQRLLKSLGYSRICGPRSMIESGAALAVMGNHELNALAFHTADPHSPGEHLRRHNEKNSHQHAETLRQVPAGELASYLAWFRTLPIWLDLEGLRVVHACWDERMADHVAGQAVTDDFLALACLKGGDLFVPVETLLKGKEAILPEGKKIKDKDGHEQSAARVRWFDDPKDKTFRTYSIEEIDCDLPLPPDVIDAALPYPQDEKPVFVGHYWMRGSRPELLRENVACVDWSVAKGGFLCAYRWDGERRLDGGKFVWTALPNP